MSVEVVTAKVKKMVETEVEERQVVITVSEEDAAMLSRLIGLVMGHPLRDLYVDLKAVVGYDRIVRHYDVKTWHGVYPTLYVFKDGEPL